MKKLLALLPVLKLLLSTLYTEAQPIEANNLRKDYFRNPVGIPMKLSANFGELRPDHWHMGLDIRTEAKENLPIYAAAEGYVAYIGIRPSGYGRFIIINHPNGTSTLYAHLNDFNDKLEAYVTDQQYKKESWAVELELEKDQFPVSKGSFIAYSGNTGGSQGPHLHFEIMDTKTQKRFNPLLFNFGLEDNVSPTIITLAVYDRSKPVYSQTPLLYPVKQTDSGYIISKNQIIKTGLTKLSFAIKAYDRVSKGSSEDGIYSAKLYLDEDEVIGFFLDNIGFEERVYMNAHIDYRYDHNGGPYLQLLTELPGNHSTVYKKYNGDGLIELADTNVHWISIDVKDPDGNTSQLNFRIQHDDSLVRNIPRVTSAVLAPNRNFTLEKPDFKIKFTEHNLYDTVPAYYYKSSGPYGSAVSSAHYLNDPSYPLHGEALVSIKLERPISPDLSDRILIRRLNSSYVRKAEVKDGWATARVSDFGGYQLYIDNTPPRINEPGKRDTINLSASKQIVFTPSDDFGIRSFSARVNDEWLRFTNDKSRNWIYKFDERVPYGVHQLDVTVTDIAGNTLNKTWWFKREPYTPPSPKKKSSKSKKSSKKKR